MRVARIRYDDCLDKQHLTVGNSADVPHQCDVTLVVPPQTTLQSSSTLQFTIPAYMSTQALRIDFSQAAAPIDISSVAADNTAVLENTSFVSVLAFDQRDAYLETDITRNIILTPVAYRDQRKSQWGAVFDTRW